MKLLCLVISITTALVVKLKYNMFLLGMSDYYHQGYSDFRSASNKVSTKSRLNPLVIFPVKVRNSFNTGVLLYGRKVHAAYKMVEEHRCIFNLP